MRGLWRCQAAHAAAKQRADFGSPAATLGWSAEGPPPWRVACAGNSCVGWSSMGKQERCGHSSQRALYTWAQERVAHGEDLVFEECTARFATEELDKCCGEHYERISIKVCPSSLGWPMKRMRSFSVLLRRSTTIWCGPEPAAVEQHFLDLFACSTTLDADAFFASRDEDDELELAATLGRPRQKYVTLDAYRSCDFSQGLSCSAAEGRRPNLRASLELASKPLLGCRSGVVASSSNAEFFQELQMSSCPSRDHEMCISHEAQVELEVSDVPRRGCLSRAHSD